VPKYIVTCCLATPQSQVTSHAIEHVKTSECVHTRVHIGNLFLSPNIVLFNHGLELSYLSWCAPPWTSKVVQNQQPQDSLEFLMNGPSRRAKFP
jgi:hypothetical protein